MTIWEWAALALAEDIQEGDHTAIATIPKDAVGKAVLKVKTAGVWCGTEVAKVIFSRLDSHLVVLNGFEDGCKIAQGDIAFTVEGSSRSIVTAERTVLNTLQRLCGIATLTRQMVDVLEGTETKLLDTRKTSPLLRQLEKQAVLAGGGQNHRFGLFDMVLIKDNHADYCGGIDKAVAAAKAYISTLVSPLSIVAEARTMDEVEAILHEGGVLRILLDNFMPTDLAAAVKLIGGRVQTEASGGITLENLRAYAESGVDFISSGAITHSAKPLDLSLKAI